LSPSAFELLGFGPRGWGWQMLTAAGMTVVVAVCGFLLAMIVGAWAATAKLAGGRAARIAADAYTTVFRGVPDLLVIYMVFFGGGALISAFNREVLGGQGFVSLPGFAAGVIAVGICNGAYQAEVFRGAFFTVPRGEIEAARAAGMPRFLALRRVIAPQVLRFAVPGLGNCWQLALKETALISVTGLVELLRMSFIAGRSTRDFFTFLLAGAVLYLIITAVSGQGFAWAERWALRGWKRA
jgi:octopine/nopaline transport system permease protein